MVALNFTDDIVYKNAYSVYGFIGQLLCGCVRRHGGTQAPSSRKSEKPRSEPGSKKGGGGGASPPRWEKSHAGSTPPGCRRPRGASRGGAPGRTRSGTRRLRRPVLYPVELRAP